MTREVAALLACAESVLFVTGAGMSADSGLPTYRGIGGLYQDRGTDDGIPIEVALSGRMFAAKPELTWRHIMDIERACRGAAPNPGHLAIVEVERRVERPDVVLFGEALPPRAVAHLVDELERGFDLVFSVGTTSVFPYIAEPVIAAHRSGRPAVEINPGETEVSDFATHRLRARAAEALPQIVREAFGPR